jgi:hypothetical protein
VPVCEATELEEVSLFDRLADPLAPGLAPIGVGHLVSSRFPEPASGRNNQDWANFQGSDAEGRAVLIDVRGPGVMTRWWMTQRATISAPAVEEDVIVRMYVDGREVLSDDAGMSMRELVSGSHAAFPQPWAAGPAEASGSLLVALPIHFAESLRVTAERKEGFDIYYMIDWRELPCGTTARSFDGTLTADEQAALAAATQVWIDGDRGTLTSAEAEGTIAPGAALEVRVAGPAVIHRLEAGAVGDLASLELELLVDGAIVASAPAHVVLMATTPSEPYASAQSSFDGTIASLVYPIRVDTEATLRVVNGSAAPVDAWSALAHRAEPAHDALRRARVVCTDQRQVEGGNFGVAEATGPGHLAGHFLAMDAMAYGFAMLEGDPEIFADDRELLGTGVEDLFGGAHYFIYGPFAHPLQGAPGVDRLDPGRPRVAMFRHFMLDAVDFERELRFEYEAIDPGTRVRACSVLYGVSSP